MSEYEAYIKLFGYKGGDNFVIEINEYRSAVICFSRRTKFCIGIISPGKPNKTKSKVLIHLYVLLSIVHIIKIPDIGNYQMLKINEENP